MGHARRVWSELKRTKVQIDTEAQTRLQTAEQEIVNILTAIKAGIITPTTKQALEQAEAQRAQMLEAIRRQDKNTAKITSCLPKNLSKQFRQCLDGFASVTRREIEKARGILETMVGGQIALRPNRRGQKSLPDG